MQTIEQNWVDSQHRTDDQSKVGQHVFTVAGLGKAPFQFIDVVKKAFVAAPGAPMQPAGQCAYCGLAIIYCCVVDSSDGKRFEVGTDCVARTADTALVKKFKNSPQWRAINRQKATDRDARVVAEWNALMVDEAACAKLTAFRITTNRGEPKSWLEFAKTAWGYCGMAGHSRYLKTAKGILAGTITH